MIEYIKILVELIGHIVWPLVLLIIAFYFKGEVPKFLKRVKKAKYGELELDLSEAIAEVKSTAIEAGITIAYPAKSFNENDMALFEQAPEWAFIKSWQNIENLLMTPQKGERKKPITRVIKELAESSVIDFDLSQLVLKMNRLRNDIVHSQNIDLTRGEALEWLGLSRSVHDRLKQKLSVRS